MNIKIIQELCQKKALRWTNHIFVRLQQRNINMNDVIDALISGEIIENYPEDYPYPSCLVIGYTKNNKILHVVCGASNTELWLITAYYPNPDEWSTDFKVRKEN